METLTKNYSSMLLLLILLLVSIPGGLSAIDNFESLEVLHRELPSYPTSMIYIGIYEGSAQVVVNVDESGELKDVYVAAFTHLEFGRMAEKYIWKWTFQPAKLNGEPLGVVKAFNFGFEDRRGVFAVGVQESVAAMFNFSEKSD